MIHDIHTSGLSIKKSTRRHIERRIAFALGRFEDSINAISVTVEDTNGTRGGIDQLCRIRISLQGERNPIIAESKHEHLNAAIDMTADCIGRSVARALDKRHRSRRVPLILETA